MLTREEAAAHSLLNVRGARRKACMAFDEIMAIWEQGLHIQYAFAWGESADWLHPVAWVDTTERPDVADLVRLQWTEGEGEFVSTWAFAPEDLPLTYFFLRIEQQRPVHALYWVTFPIPELLDIVEAIGRTKELSLVPSSLLAWQSWHETHPGPLQASVGELLDRLEGHGLGLLFDAGVCANLLEHVHRWRRLHPQRTSRKRGPRRPGRQRKRS